MFLGSIYPRCMKQKKDSAAVRFSRNWISPGWWEEGVAVNNQIHMKRMIDAREFALTELALYLDTHPDDQKALQLRAQFQKEVADLKKKYEAHFGPLIITHSDVQGPCWTWVNNPWPWDYQKEA